MIKKEYKEFLPVFFKKEKKVKLNTDKVDDDLINSTSFKAYYSDYSICHNSIKPISKLIENDEERILFF
jgi:hypothetical protein